MNVYHSAKSYKTMEDIENLSICVAFRDNNQQLCVRRINEYSDIEDYQLVLIDQVYPADKAGTRFIIEAGDQARGIRV